MPADDLPDDVMLDGVAANLDLIGGRHARDGANALLAARALRGAPDALEVIGGPAAQARLAVLALLASSAHPVNGTSRGPAFAARFLAVTCGGVLQAPPIHLVGTSAGAEQARRLLEDEPPLPAPDPDRIAKAALLTDLTPEEAFAAYAAGTIASPRVMEVTGLRTLFDIVSALTRRGLSLPRRPSFIGDGRDDRDLLWEMEGQRDYPISYENELRYPRPTPPPSPELDAAWLCEIPDDPASRERLAAVADALEALARAENAEAARAEAAASGLRGDASVLGGLAARARIVAWVRTVVEQTRSARQNADSWPFAGAIFILQPLLTPGPAFDPIADGKGALELALTDDGAFLVERWLITPLMPEIDPARVIAATDLGNLTEDEAYAAYAEGRISSSRLMVSTGAESFIDVLTGLGIRGLTVPETPTYVGPGRDDRDLLWETWAGTAEEEH